MTPKNKEWAINVLKARFEELSRMPKKDDFDEVTRSRIKAFLGPWPRALEAACLKPAKKAGPVTAKTNGRRTKNVAETEIIREK